MNNLILSIFAFIFMTVACGKVMAAPLCAKIFTPAVMTSAIKSSIENSIIELAKFRVNLDLAKVRGSNSIEMTALATAYTKKENALLQYLEDHNFMTREEYLENLKIEILDIQGIKKKEIAKQEKEKEDIRQKTKIQEQQLKDTAIDGRVAIFNRVEPGSFVVGIARIIPATITKPFEMMATVTTQVVWKTVAELALEKLKTKYKLNVDPSHFKGDTRPVESISSTEIREWIRALNKLSQAGEPALETVIAGHKKGDVYRLPTEAEWDFVITGRGTLLEDYHFGHDKDKILRDDYAWTARNANETQAVALKKPLIVDGKEFFDLHGNVREMVLDFFHKNQAEGIDPLNRVDSKKVTFRGGSWNRDSYFSESYQRQGWDDPYKGSFEDGFRLVREVRRK